MSAYEEPGFEWLDTFIRTYWLHEKCPHLSMLIKRSTGSVDQEREL